jgi:putative ABC transport system ATP-binding protein
MPSLQKPILSLDAVMKTYGAQDAAFTALYETDLTIARGDFLAIVGESGSGKSTLLNLLGGLDRPTSGKILHEGNNLAIAKDRYLTLYRRRTTAFIFQFYNLIPTLTALENVTVAHDIATDPLDPHEVIEQVGLTPFKHHFPAQLSGGQQQRVAIARALVANTPVLLCDEPTGALDSRSSGQIMQLISSIHQDQGKTIIFVTHNKQVAHYCTRLIEIVDGRLKELAIADYL